MAGLLYNYYGNHLEIPLSQMNFKSPKREKDKNETNGREVVYRKGRDGNETSEDHRVLLPTEAKQLEDKKRVELIVNIV